MAQAIVTQVCFKDARLNAGGMATPALLKYSREEWLSFNFGRNRVSLHGLSTILLTKSGSLERTCNFSSCAQRIRCDRCETRGMLREVISPLVRTRRHSSQSLVGALVHNDLFK